jgi:hypothetical protein
MEGETGRGPGGVKAGRRCRAASSPAHGHDTACGPSAVETTRTGTGAALEGQAGSLGWAGKEAQAQLSENNLFFLFFKSKIN